MPRSPSSSPDIVCISPPPSAQQQKAKRKRDGDDAGDSSSSRARVTERMLRSLSSSKNPITHSNAFQNTQHVHSCSTGHQQRGGDRGFWATARDAGLRPDVGPEHTYWSVRTANVEAGAREKANSILAGCVIAINGPTGPRVSNLQLQNLITSNGGRYVPHQSSRCTHVVAARLSGTKAQKHINGQGGRGAAKRTQVVKVEWVLDCVAKGKRLSEAGYLVVEDPTQNNILSFVSKTPKTETTKTEVIKAEATTPQAHAKKSGTL